MASAEALRRADLAAIHVAKKALGWDDDMYRDIMFTVCSVRSAGELDHAGRVRFLKHLQSCGATATGPNSRQKATQASRKPWTTQHKLVWSLWQQLADAGLARQRDRVAIDAWIKQHQVGVDRLEWCNAAQLDLVILGLKQWLARKPKPEVS